MDFEDQLERNNEIVGQMAEGNEVTNENLEAINAQLSEGLGGIEGKLRLTDNPDITLAEAFTQATMEQTSRLSEAFESLQEFMGDTFGAAFSGVKGIAEGQGFFDTIGGWLGAGLQSLGLVDLLTPGDTAKAVKSFFSKPISFLRTAFMGGLRLTGIVGALATLQELYERTLGWWTGESSDTIANAIDSYIQDNPVLNSIDGYLSEIPVIGSNLSRFLGTMSMGLESLASMSVDAGDWLLDNLFGEETMNEEWRRTAAYFGDLFRGDFESIWNRTVGEWEKYQTWFTDNFMNPLKNIWSDTKSTFRQWSDDISTFLSTMPGRLSDRFLTQVPESLGGISDTEFFENRLQRQSEAGASAGSLDRILREGLSDVGPTGAEDLVSSFRGVAGGPNVSQRIQDAVNQADNNMATGGMLTEPVFGIGMETGETYGLAEEQNEMVTPVQGTNTQSTTTPETPDVNVDNNISGLTENMENTNSLLQQILNALQQQSNSRSQPPKTIGDIPAGEQDQSTELIARGLM